MYVSPSGKKYIGQTIRENQRKFEHKNKTIKTNTYFGKALKKYGYANFEYWVLFKFKTNKFEQLKKVLDYLEKRCIIFYKTNIKEFGYNLNKGGGGNRGYKHSKEIIDYLKTLPKNEAQKEGLKLGRTTRSEEIKKKISQSQKKNSKPVYKCDLNGNILEIFDSINDAARSFEDNHITRAKRIGECCNGKRKTIYGFIWKK